MSAAYRWIVILGALLIAGLCTVPVKAFWQSRLQVSVGAAPGYTGPGDVVSGASMWWGLRCYNTAYTGNVADVYAPADASHTLLTCSSGGTINETLQSIATTCATSCTVKTLYDQSSALSCFGGVACDLVQATSANRPSYSATCVGGKPCMVFAGSAHLDSATTVNPGVSQPITVTAVTERTGNLSAQNQIFTANSGGFNLNFANSAAFGVFAGSAQTASETDNAFHAVQWIANGASSVLYIDGSSNAISSGTNGTSNGSFVAIGDCPTGECGPLPLTGKISESGAWPSAFSGGNQSAMNSNQHTYYGF